MPARHDRDERNALAARAWRGRLCVDENRQVGARGHHARPRPEKRRRGERDLGVGLADDPYGRASHDARIKNRRRAKLRGKLTSEKPLLTSRAGRRRLGELFQCLVRLHHGLLADRLEERAVRSAMAAARAAHSRPELRRAPAVPMELRAITFGAPRTDAAHADDHGRSLLSTRRRRICRELVGGNGTDFGNVARAPIFGNPLRRFPKRLSDALSGNSRQRIDAVNSRHCDFPFDLSSSQQYVCCPLEETL